MIKTIAENYNILEITTRILVAYIVGALIGWERAQHKKPIGSRTTSIVCMGAAILSCYEEIFAKSILIQNSQLMEIGANYYILCLITAELQHKLFLVLVF